MAKTRKFSIVLLIYFLTIIFLLCSCSSKKKDLKEESKIVPEKSSYMNFRDELRNTGVTIFDSFDNNITSIVVTDFCMETNPKTYTFTDTEKFSEFVSILSKTYWSEPSDSWDITKEFTGMRFELISDKKTTTTINMVALMVDSYGVVEIINNGKSKIYEISENAYLDMRAFATKRYYLHKSSIEEPKNELCLEIKNQILLDLDEKKRTYISTKMRNLHYTIEKLLIENVSYLKEADSSLWELAITGHGENVNKGNFSFNRTMQIIQEISDITNDKETKIVFKKLYNDLKKACKNRDIDKIFYVHEVIHDYDYYAINYPAHYDLQPADWGGIGVYFGHLRSE